MGGWAGVEKENGFSISIFNFFNFFFITGLKNAERGGVESPVKVKTRLHESDSGAILPIIK